MANNPLKVSSAKEWRRLREEGIVYEFRSGLVARIRPVSIVELHALGKIPESLISIAHEIAVGKASVPEMNDVQAKKGLDSLKDLIAIVAEKAFIEPKVSLEVPTEDQEDSIWLYDISYQDQMELLEVSQAPAAALIRFREEQESNAEPV